VEAPVGLGEDSLAAEEAWLVLGMWERTNSVTQRYIRDMTSSRPLFGARWLVRMTNTRQKLQGPSLNDFGRQAGKKSEPHSPEENTAVYRAEFMGVFIELILRQCVLYLCGVHQNTKE
jgi:hypothetical protein